MIIEACMLFFGMSIDFDKINTDTVSKLNTGVSVTLKQDNLSIRFENRYYIKEFKKKALGFSLSDSLYTFDAKYLLSENKDIFLFFPE